jgi:hypothetical protein
MATGNSSTHVAGTRNRLPARLLAAGLGGLALCSPARDLVAAERVPRRFAAGAEQRFEEARTRFQADTNDATRAWQLGRAAFDWAEFARDNRHREAIALEGIAACRLAVARNDQLAAGHYYLGMNLGQLARVRKLEALGFVKEMERCFETARHLQETLDFAGPDRNLGLLYWHAPGWPASIGNRSQARAHLERAAKLEGGYPDNRLNLMEALLDWKDTGQLQQEVTAYTELLPRARQAFAGAAWEQGWHEWEERWEQLRKELERRKK